MGQGVVSHAGVGVLRAGNAGANTAADHITVIDQAIEALPAHVRPGAETSPGLLVRSDSAGATKDFAAHCHCEEAEFSFGLAVDHRIKTIIEEDKIPEDCWAPAIEANDGIRDGAWVVDATDYIDISTWPAGTRLVLRKERPHPGAQLSFTDADGHRVTAFITDTETVAHRRVRAWSCAIASMPGSRTGSGRPKLPAWPGSLRPGSQRTRHGCM